MQFLLWYNSLSKTIVMISLHAEIFFFLSMMTTNDYDTADTTRYSLSKASVISSLHAKEVVGVNDNN